ncbi:hypothetical protein GJV80_16615 [Microlunatus sp. Gsoil 973]|nr:hypothetical protein GJV80_16615 [Microlunatus sp. Gsoil 973]
MNGPRGCGEHRRRSIRHCSADTRSMISGTPTSTFPSTREDQHSRTSSRSERSGVVRRSRSSSRSFPEPEEPRMDHVDGAATASPCRHNHISRRRVLGAAGGIAAGVGLGSLVGAAPAAAVTPRGTGVRFAAVSDTHISISSSQSMTWLTQVYASIAAREPDAVLHCGDITDTGLAEEFRLYGATVPESLQGRIHYTPGNHETRWDPTAKERYRDHFGPAPYSFDLGGLHVIGFDPSEVLQEPGHYGRSGLDWLRDDVAGLRPGTAALLFQHFPLGNDYYFLDDQPAVLSALVGLPALKGIIAGHIHREDISRFNGITQVARQCGEERRPLLLVRTPHRIGRGAGDPGGSRRRRHRDRDPADQHSVVRYGDRPGSPPGLGTPRSPQWWVAPGDSGSPSDRSGFCRGPSLPTGDLRRHQQGPVAAAVRDRTPGGPVRSRWPTSLPELNSSRSGSAGPPVRAGRRPPPTRFRPAPETPHRNGSSDSGARCRAVSRSSIATATCWLPRPPRVW